MALKKEDKVRLDGIKKTFNMLVSNGIPQHQIIEMMQPQFDEFEQITGSKIRTEFGHSPSLEVLDLSKDFIRVRFPNEDNRVLRTKVQGVPVDIKLFKRDDFEFSNNEVASALRALANEVEVLPMPLNSLEACDVRKEKEKADNNSDNHGDAEVIDQEQVVHSQNTDALEDNEPYQLPPEEEENLPV